MRRKLISVFLFLVMMIVVLHNVIPHHHHEEILIHNHDSHHDNNYSHPENDHQPVSCLIQSLTLTLPRVLTTCKFEIPSDDADLIGTLSNSVHITNDEFSLSYVPIPPCDPLDDGVIHDLPPRAPPC
jgi:hypothetical protein